MTGDELKRMRAYAEAAREHPTWSVAYARDVPKLLAEVERLRLALGARNTEAEKAFSDEFDRLGAHDLLVTEERNLMEARWYRAEHRLRFAEMVLDRVGAEVDGVPWREAARLSESLDGEPVTDAEPLAKRIAKQEHMAGHLIETCRWYAEDFAGPENEWRHFVGVEVPDQVMRIVTEPVAPASDPGVKSGD